MGVIVSGDDLFSLLTDGAATGQDDYVSRITGGSSGAPESIYTHKEARVQGAAASTAIASQWIDLREYEGSPLGHGAFPAAFANPTNANAGGLHQTDAVTGNKRLLSYGHGNVSAGLLCIYDLLAHNGGYDATNTGAQNFNGGSDGATTRYTNGVGNQLWAIISGQIGVTATTLTASYKNGAGSSKTTQPVVFGGTNRREAQRMIPLSLAAGDNTVKSALSCTVLVTTGTPGNFGLAIVHPLVYVPVSIGASGTMLGFLDGPVPVIQPGAHLCAAFLPLSALALVSELFVNFGENL